MPETIRCSICHKSFRVKSFEDGMAKLRHHRKLAHPRAFKESIKKGIRTRKSNK